MSVREQLLEYLDDNIERYLENWKSKIRISDSDVHQDKVEENGVMMYRLVQKNIEAPICLDRIIALAKKVACERVEANVNIGDFIYNVNAGRSVLMKHMTYAGIEVSELQSILDSINELFDQFSYHAVSEYTRMKNNELQEKISFIDETHQEKLSILGQMSSSFVHEFRNPLTAIMGFVKLLQKDYPDLEYIDVIDHELQQLNFRISQFLHVSKKEIDVGSHEWLEVKTILEGIIDFIYPSIVDCDVEIHNNIPEKLNIFGQQDKLRQVFLNIMMNSIDALKETTGPRRIELHCDQDEEMVNIYLTNNGPRIPAETLKTIFEPFYTTKELGTGIGLYVCRKIIQNHQGRISCHSVDEYTTFKVSLPLAEKLSIEQA
ncbi:histidine kinase N-terminal domain-containing protein [Alkalihalobacillus macyae]|uniref:histidine kinase N-terminal domain-containing protein n=1 Tax=Guptibacillus hwajinpoensis TaxID=208199 RepID=UPI00273B4817|nr:histidine kinase N-terminal domain-containing protein [Alkalihalobacillus macyae]MDP4550560.1 histidine kinase N-terminal domain-containing protein [Alkalihalobacillus macyae]